MAKNQSWRPSIKIALILLGHLSQATAWGMEEDGVPNLYPLTSNNGPIMVKVASFKGDEAHANANALAEELRKSKGVETYTFRFQVQGLNNPTKEEQQAFEERYKVKMRLAALNNPPPENWVVLAGNFESFESRDAQSMLKKLQKYKPKSIKDDAWQITYFDGNSEKKLEKPLVSAMLVPNPLGRSQRPAAIRPETAKLLCSLNDDEPYSIYKLAAPYTICMFEFRGASTLNDEQANRIFEGKKFKAGETGLQKAAHNAILVTEQLRKMNVEAYVFHGEFASLVCVGGFQGQDDPELQPALERYSKMQVGDLQPAKEKYSDTPIDAVDATEERKMRQKFGEYKKVDLPPVRVIPTPRRPRI
ncbi:MAG: hypothetical protein U1D30_09505 [Planctomycetota bacterium]